MNLLPIFLKLDGRRGLVVGAGSVALEKIGSLLTTGLLLRVVAPKAKSEIRQLAAESRIEFVERPFAIADLDGNFIVIAATNDPDVNASIYQSAVARGILANSVDDPPNCDFYFGSVVRRGELQIAISTAGKSPAVAQRLRREIDEQLPHDLGPWLAEVGRLRREVLVTHPRGEERKLLLRQLAQRPACAAMNCPTRQLVIDSHPFRNECALNVAPNSKWQTGKVYLVGAGPGDPELLTVKALRLIQSADLILHDDLVPQVILRLAPSAEIVNVGKRCGEKKITQPEINTRMIEQARAGRSVVRLKSGDPLLFGRAVEEIAALAEARVPFEIVPGITAGFAAATALGCSLTSRDSASTVVFSTGHHARPKDQTQLREEATHVIYMPGRELSELAQLWLDEGVSPDLPCAVVSQASQPGQQMLRTTLAALGQIDPLPAPTLLIAGWVLLESAVNDEALRAL
jgi:uroporphyrin-III C-methyltransferase/precorrin-2 dehydrogenase/sirohydrochlorin ferrochelatase